ncbi:ABC-2 family transporter protein [Candidatus Berkelbacteria bacterium]|nr:ABC-2 family transporter protein [Candidatus Berkelbacteria bacterium]
MRKYLTIIQAFWQRALTYRFTVLAYRTGEMGELLVLVVMWTAIFANQPIIQGFTLQEMITYILVGNLFQVIVRNFLSNVIARDIKDGRLSMFLIKPMSYMSYILAQEIGRISLATLMSILSQLLIIGLFTNAFLWNWDPATLIVIAAMVFLAFVTELFLSYLVGLIAFWTDEVDGIYDAVYRVRRFFAGGYFPLSLLPPLAVQVSSILPFAYSFFVPAQLYLGKIELVTGLQGLLIQLGWIVALFGFIAFVWDRGLRRYEGVGI